MGNGEFHRIDGWFFKRLDNGDVRVRHVEGDGPIVIPALQWCSIVVAVSKDPSDYAAVERMHIASPADGGRAE